MRRILALILVAGVSLGAADGGAPKRAVVVRAAPLRGAQSPAPVRAPGLPPALAAPAMTLWIQAGQDDANCRRACNQTYYFCAADGSSDDCGSSYSQCAAACAVPTLARTAP